MMKSGRREGPRHRWRRPQPEADVWHLLASDAEERPRRDPDHRRDAREEKREEDEWLMDDD